jgi:hypothetical protein
MQEGSVQGSTPQTTMGDRAGPRTPQPQGQVVMNSPVTQLPAAGKLTDRRSPHPWGWTLASLLALTALFLACSTPALAAEAPSILSESAPSPKAEEARLEAVVNPHNEPTECHFQYGTASVSEHEVECEQGNALGGEEQGVAANVSGLAQNTTYHYRVSLKNTLGEEAVGATEPFTTALHPEAPVTLAAELVTGTTATFTGELNPNVTAKDGYYFSYDNNGTCEPAFTTPPGVETTETKRAVSTPVSGLEGSTEYMVCLVATNEVGEASSGSPITFTTLAEKPVIEPGGEKVSGVGSRSVTFEANVNPENQETTVVFEYATEPSVLLASNGIKVSAGASIPPAGGYQYVNELAEALAPATTYYFRVVATNATGTTHTIPVAFTTLAVPLVEETEPEALEVTAHTALIANITVNPEMEEPLEEPREEPTYYILYGTTEAYEHALPAPLHAGAGYGLTGREVSPVALYGLTPGTTYHYAVVAHNQNGTQTSRDRQFTTAAAEPLTTPPAVGASSAQFANEGSAVIEGEINPEGLPVAYEVQYGASSAYGSSSPAGQVAPFTSAQGTITALTGLQSGTTYHYRLAATNAAGTSYGPDETFTTTGATQTGAFTPFTVPSTPQINIAPFSFPPEEASKRLTNKQKLAAALKACAKKHNRAKRASCQRQAKRTYR